MMGFAEKGEPDPEFKAFFAGDWKRLMEAVTVPGMQYASWDRKAAYLLWCMGSHYTNDTGLDDWQSVLTGHLIPEETKPAMPAGGWGEVLALTNVGKRCNCANIGDCDGSCQFPGIATSYEWTEAFDASTVKPVVNRVDPNGIDAAE